MLKIINLVPEILKGMWEISVGFLAVTLLLSHKKDFSLLWQVPLGALSCSILLSLFPENITTLLRTLILVSSITVGFTQKRTFAFFVPVALSCILLKNIFALGAMWAMAWQCIKELCSSLRKPVKNKINLC